MNWFKSFFQFYKRIRRTFGRRIANAIILLISFPLMFILALIAVVVYETLQVLGWGPILFWISVLALAVFFIKRLAQKQGNELTDYHIPETGRRDVPKTHCEKYLHCLSANILCGTCARTKETGISISKDEYLPERDSLFNLHEPRRRPPLSVEKMKEPTEELGQLRRGHEEDLPKTELSIKMITRCHECPEFEKKRGRFGYCRFLNMSISDNHLACETMRNYVKAND